ncbi:regulator of chromosome condensation 1/beta-lactamase-inhibitor protein II [Baffinella frigidus]|nr:regulator of chromosome condensation 1/beta-lactamase-inhibitor protein II [Cryptophyta sp. CCMP2293]
MFDEATGGREAVAIQVGAQHTVIQDKEGNLWMFGNNRFGQLGRPDNAGTLQESWVPTLFNATYVGGVYNDSSEVRIADVTVGYYHTLLRTLDRLGEARLWAFGSNEFGQLGHTVRVGKCIDPSNPNTNQ